jgi:hypothetical protein
MANPTGEGGRSGRQGIWDPVRAGPVGGHEICEISYKWLPAFPGVLPTAPAWV